MDVRIENSLELLTQDEWDKYLATQLFDKMQLTDEMFGISGDFLSNISHPLLHEMIQEHNNKIGSLTVTYALCMHYFDKGIPDDPWYISPGMQGQSVQYMPLFQEEHWMRQYWFNYFSDTFYLKISSVWDSTIEIINHYFHLGYASDLRLRSNVLKWLKTNRAEVNNIFEEVMQSTQYKDAQKYRTAAAHGTSAGTVQNTVTVENDVWVDVIAKGDDGKPILDESGNVTMKKVKAAKKISMRVGDYTNVATIQKNMEEYAAYTGDTVERIIKKVLE